MPDLMTYDEAAQKLGIKKGTLQKWVNKGLITYVKYGDKKGSSVRFALEDLDAFISNRRRDSAAREEART